MPVEGLNRVPDLNAGPQPRATRPLQLAEEQTNVTGAVLNLGKIGIVNILRWLQGGKINLDRAIFNIDLQGL